jgi:hypothetical protein
MLLLMLLRGADTGGILMYVKENILTARAEHE